MQPNQNDFQFIINPDSPKKSGPAFLQNPKQRNIFAGLFIVLILAILLIIGSLLFSSGGEEVTGTTAIAAYQNELIRLSDSGLKSASDPSFRAELTSLKSFLTSDYSSTKSYLALNGVEFTKILASSKQDPKTDAALNTASQRNQYDAALQELIDENIVAYKAAISSETKNNPGPKKKVLLDQITKNIIVFDQ